MPPDKIDSLADDVKALVLELLQQNSGLMARIDELVAQNKAADAALVEQRFKKAWARADATPAGSRF